MHAEAPSFDAAIRSVESLAARESIRLSQRHYETLGEVRRRLERLSVEAARLIDLNNRLVDADRVGVEFDPDSDTVVFRAGDAELKVQLRRANPDVPIRMTPVTSGGSYDAAQDAREPSDNADLRREFETGIEAFYNSAHRVLKLLKTIPGLRKLSCKEVTIVRNKLVEHPGPGSVYSFGYGSTGPRIKPMRRGLVEWNDDGLVPNMRAFVHAIETGIARLLSSAT